MTGHVAEVEDMGCVGIVCRAGKIRSGSEDELEIRLVSLTAGELEEAFDVQIPQVDPLDLYHFEVMKYHKKNYNYYAAPCRHCGTNH